MGFRDFMVLYWDLSKVELGHTGMFAPRLHLVASNDLFPEYGTLITLALMHGL